MQEPSSPEDPQEDSPTIESWRTHSPPSPPAAARLVGTVVGLAFGGIGLTVLAFLWGSPFGEFGSPPLFFRIFGSFIALVFVAVGGAAAYAAITGQPLNELQQHLRDRMTHRSGVTGGGGTRSSYVCPQCAAPLAEGADVSPHGDVKCTYCQAWFNVHGR